MLTVLLALLSTAGAWPSDDAWVPLAANGMPLSDLGYDAPEPGLEIVGHHGAAAASWSADEDAVWLRLRLSGDPRDGDALRAGVWGFAVDASGDGVLDLLFAVEGPSGVLTVYTGDGTPGAWPGFAALSRVGEIGGDAVRVTKASVGHHLELELPRALLEDLGIEAVTSFRLAAVTGTTLYAPWVDLSRCGGLCADLDDALTSPVVLDADLDGLTLPWELLLGTDPHDADTDDDGLLDGQEPKGDTDGDGLVDARDCDSDGDGLRDGTEAGLVLEDLHPDTDITKGCFIGDADPSTTTDPYDADTDGGGIPDGVEDRNRNGRLDPPWETDPTDDGDDLDTDGDGIPDVLELLQPDGSVDDDDSDGDGIPDAVEGVRDTDGDGVPDFLDLDSDGDGIPDADEGYGDTDGDGILDFRDLDCDGDFLPDYFEGVEDTDGDGIPDYKDPDSDGDGIPDWYEGVGDTDGDGTPDRHDLDSDGDGIPDEVEGFGDTDGDGVLDFRDLDADGDTIPDAIEGYDDVDGDGVPNFQDLDSDGDGIPDRIEGLGDEDCDGIPDFLDPDPEDSFCDPMQEIPPVDDSEQARRERPVVPAGGDFTGGTCATAPGPSGFLPIVLVAAALRRRRVAWAGLLAAGPALAQDVDAQRFAPSVDGGPFVKVEDTWTPPPRSVTAGAWLGYADRPFTYRPAGRDEPVDILGSVATTHLVAALGLGRLVIGADVPVHVHADAFGFAPSRRATHLGDLRLSSKAVILRSQPAGLDGLDLGVLAEATLPTGAPDVFLGAGAPRVRAAAIGTLTAGRLVATLNLGARSGTGSVVGPLVVGPALQWGAGVGYGLTEALSASLEVDGDRWTGNAGQRGAAPVEWLGAAHLQTALGRLSMGAGTGLSSGIGAPDLRVAFGLTAGPAAAR